MESQLFLQNYRVSSDSAGAPLELRRNATGVTYKGENVRTSGAVAIEFVATGLLKPRVRQQLAAEATAAKQLGHVNIPALYDFGFEGDRFIYVSEYLEGISAEEWVATHGPMPAAAVLRIALQIISALRTAAFYGITHHAISPSRLVIVPGKPAGVDWPLVKLLDLVGLTPPASESGSGPTDQAACFVSPEQLQDRPVDFRSEVYSLGCTLWFLLTGKPPFATSEDAAAARPMTMVLDLEKFGLPATARRLLLKMLSIDPEERPHDPVALDEQLRACLRFLPQSRPVSSRKSVASTALPIPMVRPAPRRRFAAKSVAFAALLLASAAFAAILRPERFQSLHLPGRMAEIVSFLGSSGASDAQRNVAETPSKANPTNPPDSPAPTPGAAPIAAATNERPQLVSLAGRDAPSSPGIEASAAPVGPPTKVAAEATELVTVAEVSPSPDRPEVDQPSVDVAVASSPAEAQSAEAAPPAEGPGDSPASPEIATQSQTEVPAFPPPAETPAVVEEEQSPAPTASPKETARSSKSVKGKAATKKRSTRRKSRTRSSSKRPAETPSPSPGLVRAQFVGKTADGKWLLELPPNQNQPKGQEGQPRQVIVDPKP